MTKLLWIKEKAICDVVLNTMFARIFAWGSVTTTRTRGLPIHSVKSSNSLICTWGRSSHWLLLRTPLPFLFFCIKITLMSISCNNKEISPLLPETIQKHREGLQWRLQTLLLGHVQWLFHAVLILALLLSAQKMADFLFFSLTLPWPSLSEKTWVGGREASVSMERVHLWGWLGSIQMSIINILWKKPYTRFTVPSFYPVWCSPFTWSQLSHFVLLAASLIHLLPNVFSRQLAWPLPSSFSVPLPSLPGIFQVLCLSPNPCSVNGRAV